MNMNFNRIKKDRKNKEEIKKTLDKQEDRIYRSDMLNEFYSSFDETVAILDTLLTYDNKHVVNDINVEPFKKLFYKQIQLVKIYNDVNKDFNRNIKDEVPVLTKMNARKQKIIKR